MKLVRARPRRVEDLPEWAKCCDHAVSALELMGETVADSEDQHVFYGRICGYCGEGLPSLVSIKITLGIAAGCYVPMVLIDLDEGPMEQTSTA